MNELNNRTRRKAIGRVCARLLAAVLMVFLAAELPAAQARQTPTIIQITNANSPQTEGVSISANGARIAFESDGNLTGHNPDRNEEIFLFDIGTWSFTQITNSTEALNSDASVNAEGTLIAFSSSADLTGGNADRNIEIFLFDATNDALTQITDSDGPFQGNGAPKINADGTRIVFESELNLTGDNPDGSSAIFLFDITAGTLTQIVDLSSMPSINGDGSRIGFVSDRDLTGSNADGNYEIFLLDTRANNLTQITDTVEGYSLGPIVNLDGTRIAFQSTSDLTESNLDHNPELFLFDLRAGTFTQITHSTRGRSSPTSLNAQGTRIAFASTSDLTGENPGHTDHIFLFDAMTNTFIQIAESGGASISVDGARMAFAASGDLIRPDPDGLPEVFLAVIQGEVPTAVELDYFHATARPLRVILNWETSSEIGMRGFNLWRSKSAHGKYVKINRRLIPARGDVDREAEYRYVDRTGFRRVRYYYKLQAVDVNGNSTFFGPVPARRSGR